MPRVWVWGTMMDEEAEWFGEVDMDEIEREWGRAEEEARRVWRTAKRRRKGNKGGSYSERCSPFLMVHDRERDGMLEIERIMAGLL